MSACMSSKFDMASTSSCGSVTAETDVNDATRCALLVNSVTETSLIRQHLLRCTYTERCCDGAASLPANEQARDATSTPRLIHAPPRERRIRPLPALEKTRGPLQKRRAPAYGSTKPQPRAREEESTSDERGQPPLLSRRLTT